MQRKKRHPPKKGRPAVSLKKIRTISRLLTRKASVPEIVKSVGLSKTTVDRVRADYNAVLMVRAYGSVDIGESVPDIEWRQGERRAKMIKTDVYKAIIQGIADASKPKDILDLD